MANGKRDAGFAWSGYCTYRRRHSNSSSQCHRQGRHCLTISVGTGNAHEMGCSRVVTRSTLCASEAEESHGGEEGQDEFHGGRGVFFFWRGRYVVRWMILDF